MKFRNWSVTWVIFLAVFAPAQPSLHASDPPTESEHRNGPNGFEGWTLNYSVVGHGTDERYPMTLVVAHNGRMVNRIEGEPFVWDWIFWANGRQIAYETGPFHFDLHCVLADSATGRRLARYDCFHGIPDNAPSWLKALGKSRNF